MDQIKILTILIPFFMIALASNAKNDTRADIFFNNGDSLINVEIKIPGNWNGRKDVECFIDEKKKKIHTDSVDYIKIYHVDAPFRKAIIGRNPVGTFDRKKNKTIGSKYKNWQVLMAKGDHLSYWIAFWKLKIDKDGITYKMGHRPDTYVSPYCFQKTSEKYSVDIPCDIFRPEMIRDWLKAYLSDDPAICERISEKGYYSKKYKDAYRNSNSANPFFFEDIAEDYNPIK